MIPRELIDVAAVPGGETLRLFRRGDEWSIMLGANELMNSRLSSSEEALAALGCADVPPGGRVLIGGLGMGFTLRAALALLPPDAQVTVAELVPEVIDWARGPMAALHGDSLGDPRVRIVAADVARVIAEGGWDAILLDVDNGPDGITQAGNDRLYDAQGLARQKAAMTPGGVLAVWSAHPSAAFVRRLAAAGFAVREVPVRARGTKGARHIVWLARRPR